MSTMAVKILAVLLWFSCVLITCVSSQSSSSFLRAANPTVSQPMSGTGTSFGMQSVSGAPNQRSAAAAAAGDAGAVASPSNTSTEKKNDHGVLSVVSWGILLPVGLYLELIGCRISGCIFSIAAYIIGAVAWGTGMMLSIDSPGITYSKHMILAMLIVCFACLNWISFCGIRLDVVAVVLSIVNIYKGFHILQPDNHKWRDMYTCVLIFFGWIFIVVGIIRCIILVISSSTNVFNNHTATAANGGAVHNHGSSV